LRSNSSGFSQATDQVKDALKQEGFGILTEIDLHAAFREKLGREFRAYIILGACNPPRAFSAINADPAVGLLLPCNVTVESIGEHRTMVRLTNPAALLATASLEACRGSLRAKRVAPAVTDRAGRSLEAARPKPLVKCVRSSTRVQIPQRSESRSRIPWP
jgi:uncharacterized protein (DUF302 family)